MSTINKLANLSPLGTSILWGVSLLIFFIFVVILAVRISKSIKEAAYLNGRINQYLAAVPADRIGTINAIYMNTCKKLSSALILCIVGGIYGFQRIYLGKRKSAVLMFLFFWTGVPTIISLFDLSVMPETVAQYNLGVIESLYNQIAAPKLEKEE